jgi:hypothetical protein
MLPHPLVSRQHCELYETEGRLMVRDLGSLNGTFINNERISDAPLPSGELLTVGAVTFRAMYESGGHSGPPGATPPAKSGKVRDTDPNGPLRAAATRPATPVSPTENDNPVDADFNFDEPLTPVDEGARVTGATVRGTNGTAKSEATVQAVSAADKAAEMAKTTPAAGKAAAAEAQAVPAPKRPAAAVPARQPTPAPPAGPAPTQPAIPAQEEKDKVNFASWDLDEKPDPKGESDDDFGDFLKSLDSK